MTSSKIDRRISAIVAPLCTHLEMLIQSVKQFNERISPRLTEGNVASDRLQLTGQRSDGHRVKTRNVLKMARQPMKNEI